MRAGLAEQREKRADKAEPVELAAIVDNTTTTQPVELAAVVECVHARPASPDLSSLLCVVPLGGALCTLLVRIFCVNKLRHLFTPCKVAHPITDPNRW